MIDYEDDYYPDRDDDSPKATAWRRYIDFWPGRGSRGEFIKVTQAVIRDAKEMPELLPPGKIRDELDKVKSAIDDLSPETLTVIREREQACWHARRASGEPFDDAYDKHWSLLYDGGSALDSVAQLVERQFDRRMQRDMLTRHMLYIDAATFFKSFGGEVEARRNASFVEYVECMLEDAGIHVGDAAQSIRAFLKRTPVVF